MTQEAYEQLRFAPFFEAISAATVPVLLLRRGRSSVATATDVQMAITFPVKSDKLREVLCVLLPRKRLSGSTSHSASTVSGTISASSGTLLYFLFPHAYQMKNFVISFHCRD